MGKSTKKNRRKKTIDFRVTKMPMAVHDKIVFHRDKRMIGRNLLEDACIELILAGAASKESETIPQL